MRWKGNTPHNQNHLVIIHEVRQEIDVLFQVISEEQVSKEVRGVVEARLQGTSPESGLKDRHAGPL